MSAPFERSALSGGHARCQSHDTQEKWRPGFCHTGTWGDIGKPSGAVAYPAGGNPDFSAQPKGQGQGLHRSEEHTSELQSLMRISYAVFCLKKKKNKTQSKTHN